MESPNSNHPPVLFATEEWLQTGKYERLREEGLGHPCVCVCFVCSVLWERTGIVGKKNLHNACKPLPLHWMRLPAVAAKLAAMWESWMIWGGPLPPSPLHEHGEHILTPTLSLSFPLFSIKLHSTHTDTLWSLSFSLHSVSHTHKLTHKANTVTLTLPLIITTTNTAYEEVMNVGTTATTKTSSTMALEQQLFWRRRRKKMKDTGEMMDSRSRRIKCNRRNRNRRDTLACDNFAFCCSHGPQHSKTTTQQTIWGKKDDKKKGKKHPQRLPTNMKEQETTTTATTYTTEKEMMKTS